MKKTLFATFILTIIATVCLAESRPQKTEPNHPSVSELVDKYAQALDSTSSFISDYEKTAEGSIRLGRGSNTVKSFSRGQLRYDNQQVYEYEYRWGDWASLTFTEDKPHYTIGVVNSEMNYQNTKRVGDRHRPGKVIRRPRPQGQNITLHAHFGVSYLAGYIGSDERLDAILRKADRIWVQEKTEKVGDSDCFVIEADTKYGRYTIWLDTEHGFHPAKVLHEAGEGDYSGRHLMAKGDSAKEYLKNVRFEKVGDVWVPMEADSGSDLRAARGDFNKDNYHYKRTKIVLNPDHNKLGSFDDPLENPSNDPELTNGTRVFKNYLPIEYTWQDGKLIPNADESAIDQMDRIAEEILAEKSGPDSNDLSTKAAEKETTIAALNASELLERYTQTQNKLRSFIAKGESKTAIEKENFRASEDSNSVFALDGNCLSHRCNYYDGIVTTKEKQGYRSLLYDGSKFYEFSHLGRLQNATLFIKKSDRQKFEKISTEYKGAALLGYCYGDSERIDNILQNAETISLKDEMENINDSNCLVIEAVTKHGEYTVWLAPDYDYNIAKITLQRNGSAKAQSFTCENVRFEKIGDIWVPMEADMQYTDSIGRTVKWHHKRTELKLNPDFDRLNAFVPKNIPEGTKVVLPGVSLDYYTWQDGKVIDKDGKVIMDCIAKNSGDNTKPQPKSTSKEKGK